MMLLTKADRAALPPLYSQDGKGDAAVAHVKFFDPTGSFTWYATEFDGDDRFFGLVDGHEMELGYFTLSELTDYSGKFGLGIERDRHWSPRPLAEIRAGRAA